MNHEGMFYNEEWDMWTRKPMYKWSDGMYRFTEEGKSNISEHWMHFRLAKDKRNG